jgi:lipopolysaccharide/colanic/teichoic acid biosynthesis glycosyltransferase
MDKAAETGVTLREHEATVAWEKDVPAPVAGAEPAPRVAPSSPEPNPAGPVRRALDVGGACLLIVVLAPALGLIALAVRLSSPGPVFYQQTRVGINRRRGLDRRHRSGAAVPVDRRRADRRTIASAGRLFRIYKFRTMVEDAEARLGPTWASQNDTRITSLGRFLRRTRLDELPQVLNVLRGDMSFIGPRPERPFFVEKFRRAIPGYMERLTVEPGITGLAQVEHRYDTNVEDVRLKLEYDVRYVRSRSLRTDVWILLRTVRVMLSGDGAH